MKRFSRLICNFSTASTRKEHWNGKTWTVVPAVIMTEGVRGGSEGPKFYTRQEMAKNVASWNMKPIVVDHPTDGFGGSISACTPDVVENQGVGLMLNTEFDGKLKTEAWFEDSRIYGPSALEPRIGQAIDRRQPLEVSTGVYVEDDYSPGTYEGKDYDYIARNLRADHLAILLDRSGACSLKDGCGTLISNARRVSANMKPFTGIVKVKSDYCFVVAGVFQGDVITPDHPAYEITAIAYQAQDDDDGNESGIYREDFVGDRDAEYPIKRAPSPSDITKKPMGWKEPFRRGYQDQGHGSNPGDWGNVTNAGMDSPYEEALPVQLDMLATYERQQRNPVANREYDQRRALTMLASGELREALPGDDLYMQVLRNGGQITTNGPATTESLPMPHMDCSRRRERETANAGSDESLPMPGYEF
jgi:hypothetical protein